MKYIIPGDPVAWSRAGRNSNRFYDKQIQLKEYWRLLLLKQHGNQRMYEGPLRVEFYFGMRIPRKPKSHQQHGCWHTSTPDLTNLEKLIEDVGTGILYIDDRFICSNTADKKYDNEPRTEFIIKELKNEQQGY